MMTIEQHIEELRAELSRSDDMAEIAQIERELREATAERDQLEAAFAAWFATLE